MASGLQCPGCGHVHPAGLPEIVRGDATFRCYGCYRTLSVPEGWSGRPTPRPSAPDVTLTGDAPRGAGTRDARSARLAGRGRVRTSALTGSGSGDLPTQMVPPVTPDEGPAATGWADAAARGAASAPGWSPSGDAATDGTRAGGLAPGRSPAGQSDGRLQSPGRRTGASAPAGAAPLGWVAPRRSGTPVPTAIRAGVWVAAFGFGLVLSAFILRKMGILDVDRVIDLYAGSGAGRFGILLLLLPMWALLSATIAHFSLEALARRRRPRPLAQHPPA